MKAFGVPAPRDGGNNAIGTFYSPNSIDPVTRQRSYSRNEYHDPATKRKNYHFIPNRTVTKIIFDKARRAVGVEVSTLFHFVRVMANDEDSLRRDRMRSGRR